MKDRLFLSESIDGADPLNLWTHCQIPDSGKEMLCCARLAAGYEEDEVTLCSCGGLVEPRWCWEEEEGMKGRATVMLLRKD